MNPPYHAKFEGVRAAGRLAADCLKALAGLVKPGAVTRDLDAFVYRFGREHGAVPATLGYKGYKWSSCISVNDVVCHGLPSGYALREGDIANIDITYVLDGWHGDCSRTFAVGEIVPAARKLLEAAKAGLDAGVAAAKPGNTVGDIGAAVQEVVEGRGFSVVRNYCGHGIGREFHTEPSILHHGKRGTGLRLEPGMVFTIEPMVNAGAPGTATLDDVHDERYWEVRTADGSLSAQFEHTVGITDDGVEVFTPWDRDG